MRGAAEPVAQKLVVREDGRALRITPAGEAVRTRLRTAGRALVSERVVPRVAADHAELVAQVAPVAREVVARRT